MGIDNLKFHEQTVDTMLILFLSVDYTELHLLLLWVESVIHVKGIFVLGRFKGRSGKDGQGSSGASFLRARD